MFRASTREDQSRVLITIDGQLSSEYVEFVDRCCEQAMAGGRRVHVLLRDVCLIDDAGRRLLCSLAAKGVTLAAKGIYNRHVISQLSPVRPRGIGARVRAVSSAMGEVRADVI